MGLSGGVDSSVAAALIHRAIGDASNASSSIPDCCAPASASGWRTFSRGNSESHLNVSDASELFLNAARDVLDPERKRRIIGHTFIDVFESEEVVRGARFLGQGTLYPDVIESVSFKGPSAVIKSHHNVGGLPDRMKLELIEPLRELFKDEVREVGRKARATRARSSIASRFQAPVLRCESSAKSPASGSNCCAAPT